MLATRTHQVDHGDEHEAAVLVFPGEQGHLVDTVEELLFVGVCLLLQLQFATQDFLIRK